MDVFKITNSKARVKILKHFFANKDKRYYLRELERILGIPVANVRRELLSLRKMGLFKREKSGKEVYYYLNRSLAIFDEVSRIISKTIGLEAILSKGLQKILGIHTCFIYGSIARGDEDALSDVDIFIIGKVDEDTVLKTVRKLEKEIARDINYTIFTKTDLLNGIKKDNVFLQDILQGNKIFLLGDKNGLAKVIS